MIEEKELEQTSEQRAIAYVKRELTHYQARQIDTVLDLLAEGNTVPFIARYRKDKTGSLDEVQIREIEERHHYLSNLIKRKDEIIRLIDEQGKLTSELVLAIEEAQTLTRLEDLYRPYKQKRRTKATIAKEAGLAPFAEWMLSTPMTDSIEQEAQRYLNEEHQLHTVEDVMAGAHEIIAEQISDEPTYRTQLRDYTRKHARLVSTLKDASLDEKGVYEMYYEYSEPFQSIVPHRVLALNRAEKEDVVRVALEIDSTSLLTEMKQAIIKHPTSPVATFIEAAIDDSYKRFIKPAIERELRNELSEKAEAQAIAIFGENLKNLLLQAPMKGQVILGLDPAYRTGCKLAVIDETGKVLGKDVIYPHKGASEQKRQAAGPQLRKLITTFGVQLIAIGNGTASRESEQFVADQLKLLDQPVVYTIVNEAGASVYSASEIARKEFPDYQVEERSAVSIARRLQDPLAELVKIDPKAVGVGQYQHDVSQKQLDEQLAFVIETAVNKVGVNLNTASAILLEHIAGLTKTTATNIVSYRDENGKFTSREQLKNVPRLGPKAFEQAVGFLRIVDGERIFDNTDIHPESYRTAQELLQVAGIAEEQIGTAAAQTALARVDRAAFMQTHQIGKETYELIVNGLIKPGRDPRDEIAGPILRSDVLSLADVQVGMELQGTVRNVVDFGAFVDIGVKQDGLVHISRLKKGFVKHPADVVAVGDIVTVWVIEKDERKGRIALSMIAPEHE